jgi:hypothetical protein
VKFISNNYSPVGQSYHPTRDVLSFTPSAERFRLPMYNPFLILNCVFYVYRGMLPEGLEERASLHRARLLMLTLMIPGMLSSFLPLQALKP